MEMFEVGGCVRDEILGVPSKDIDFTVVLDADERWGSEYLRFNHTDPFKYMVAELENQGFEIFLTTPDYLTVRARFPKYEVGRADPVYLNRIGMTADFVLARKESDYTDGRRPDTVEPGSLMDDLSRRDFTMNAIAKDAQGNLIDPFNGVADIEAKVIRAVGDPWERFNEDALRAVRALRFSVTKGFKITMATVAAMQDPAVLDAIENKISDERIMEELSKMFRFDTMKSLYALQQFPMLTSAMFAGKVSLDATMKQKGRGR
jgi:tRNA nucleotidyltransferase/poly(A) polymerase